MLVLMDRGFDGGQFLRELAATRAQFLVRLTSARHPPVLAHLPGVPRTFRTANPVGFSAERTG